MSASRAGHSPRAALPVEPWCVREPSVDLTTLAQTESLFALSNGHLGLRGNLDEGEPNATPGTYLGSFFENHPLPYPEGGYGYPESGQTLVNVTNGKIMRLLVDDEPFDVRYGDLLTHERRLDLRGGVLERHVDWVSPAGKRVRVRSTRLVSFTHRAVAGIEYEVEAVGDPVRLILQSELVTNEAPPEVDSEDPRVAQALDNPLVAVSQDVEQGGVVMLHRTRQSGLTMAAGMDHEVHVDGRYDVEHDARPDWARTTIVTTLAPGERLRVVKYLAYGWSARRSEPALRDQVAAALTAARYAGWQGLVDSQRAYLDDFWGCADVEVDGDPVLQQAVRFSLFHVLQAGARSERRGIGAKGLTGTGYNGHTFWDIEGFVLPLLTLTAPDAAANALRWRASTLDLARQRAATLGLAGAAFPWRTIDGEETSAYWPAGTAAFHLNADIARAFEQYRRITGDDSLEVSCGLEVLVETARLWLSLGHHDRHGRWHLDGVTGPDEYTAVVDDNVFTNLMAARNLRAAADAVARHPEQSRTLGVTTEESAAWRDAAEAVHLPYDKELGVHPQCNSFTRYAEWEFTDPEDDRPLMLRAPYFQLYRKQVVKQADLVLAMQWFPDAFTDEERARNFDYYEKRTVRDSSLSAAAQSVIAARTGHLRLAHDYLHEAALVDLRDLHGNTSQGLHIASLAGAWNALVEGFGGMREDGERLRLEPTLPAAIDRLSFRLRWRGARVRVEITADEVRCSLPGQPDASADLLLYDELLTVTGAGEVVRPLRSREPLLPTPTQPPGRAPEPARTSADVVS
ncbi:glycoside hydrolase family 65 protein [Cellulomonas fimi]|uniref:Glycoside hydrolase family 65 protein n=1 Tax=Cellulomonas fimi TaxID=1708 RepID=A0A7Y0QID5_CELFI|nr:glycoside hydrolase family 65 protein [Cellulomonas fimi]NMR21240.1 glycoside hydrolase family 65 protein [Cellulomonas fimi]